MIFASPAARVKDTLSFYLVSAVDPAPPMEPIPKLEPIPKVVTIPAWNRLRFGLIAFLD